MCDCWSKLSRIFLSMPKKKKKDSHLQSLGFGQWVIDSIFCPFLHESSITHMAFENWLCGRSKLVNSKIKNMCKHLLKIRVNFEEFRDMVNDMSECCEECDEIEDAEIV